MSNDLVNIVNLAGKWPIHGYFLRSRVYCTVYPRGIAHAFVIELCGDHSTPHLRRKDKPSLDYGGDSKPFGVHKNTGRGDAVQLVFRLPKGILMRSYSKRHIERDRYIFVFTIPLKIVEIEVGELHEVSEQVNRGYGFLGLVIIHNGRSRHTYHNQ